LTVLGEGFSATSLSGGGTIDGDVRLADGGTIAIAVGEDGSAAALSINGTLSLGGGRIEIIGPEKNLLPGEWTVITASKIENAEGEWVLPSSGRRNYSLAVSETSVRLFVRKRGFSVILR
ncbi:MAG: hypothetical protein IKC80_08995, partial [Kiritimatiellae bacterium]|nr:hypothetical protein [Kiritimatiellia bacterium]